MADIPNQPLSSAQVAELWATDRASLGDCGRRHSALIGVVTVMEKTR